MIDSESFGNWLKQNRTAQRLGRQKLADRAACSPETIRKIENGTRNASSQVAETLARTLGASEGEIGPLVDLARTGVYEKNGHSSQLERAVEYDAYQTQPVDVNRRGSILPTWPTRFIGREAELEAARTLLLQADIRLLTVLGAPGIGKTRFALEVARRLTGSFRDGVFYVPLMGVADPKLVITTLATTLGLDEIVGKSYTPLETVCEYARNKEILLLPDNMEHVIEAKADLSELLRLCPSIKMLVTSREPLHTQLEREFLLAPLPNAKMPAPGKQGEKAQPTDIPENLAKYDAVQLFIERARALVPTIGRTTDELIDIAYICDELDCLPLAIELAAAWSKVLMPKALRARLTDRLKLLTKGPDDLPDRQRTMHAAIDWSYSRLNKKEQTLFRRMSVFVNGRLLEAIEATCVLPGERDPDVLTLISSLLDKNLLNRETDEEGEARFSMLRTIAEYAHDRLEESNEGDILRDRHAAYYAAMSETAAPALTSPRRDSWLQRLDAELDNLRLAISWGMSGMPQETDRVTNALRIAGSLHWYWYLRGYIREGRELLDSVLEAASKIEEEKQNKEALATALDAAGRLAMIDEDFREMTFRLKRSVALWREVGNQRGLAFALTDLGAALLYLRQGEEDDGLQMILDAVGIFRELGDKWGMAFAFDFVGDAHGLLQHDKSDIRRYKERSLDLYRDLNDTWGIAALLSELAYIDVGMEKYEDAREKLERAIPLAQKVGQMGDRRYIAFATRSLGEVEWHFGRHPEARELYLTSVQLFRDIGDKMGEAVSLRVLGHLSSNAGKINEAERFYLQNLEMVRKMDSKKNIALCLMGIAGVVGQKENLRSEAAQILGAADYLREVDKGLLPAIDELQRDYTIKSLRKLLGEAQLRADMEIGRTIPLEKIYSMIDYIL